MGILRNGPVTRAVERENGAGVVNETSRSSQQIRDDSGNRLDTGQDKIQVILDGSVSRIRDRGGAVQFGSRASSRNLD